MGKKLFDYVIGNPPYNEDFEKSGDNGNYAKPVYNDFMDAAYEVGDKVELVTPARFLFNAGSTPKAWNQKMLNDEHFKVLKYVANSKDVFPNTDIKGGVAVTYRDVDNIYKAIVRFIPYPELSRVADKVKITNNSGALADIIYAPESYKFTDQMHEENPQVEEMLSKGHKYDFKSNVLQKLNQIIFWDQVPDDKYEYVQFLGLDHLKRVTRYIRRDYIREASNFMKYKVFLPESNGAGTFGEELSSPTIGMPLVGHTQTFISIGKFETKFEADACIKYIKTKFVRALLGILKKTQHNASPVWKYVPLQDFTPTSDIDWSQSIHEIDLQLYRKYGLDEKEIHFIETHVKEMA